MDIPFHRIAPSHTDGEWIRCILDLSHPVIRPFSLSDLSRFQGVEPSNEGLKEPFLKQFQRVEANHRVKPEWEENQAILSAILNRLAADRDAMSWAFLNSLFNFRIAGNDRNAWQLAEGLETLEMFALVAEERAHWGIPDIKLIADQHIRSALLKVCTLCRMPWMDRFDFLPTNKSLFQDSGIFQSSGKPGITSYFADAVPASTYAKAITIKVASQALDATLVEELQVATKGLPLPSHKWEEILKDLLEIDMSTGKVLFEERWAEQSPVVSWTDMKNHRWNKRSPLGSHDLEFVYDLGMALLPQLVIAAQTNESNAMQLGESPKLEGASDEIRDDLMQMAAVAYGKLTITNYDAEQTSQIHIDCKEFFTQLPAHESGLLGLDMFWGGKDAQQVIDSWIDGHSNEIAGALLAKYSGYDSVIPVEPNRLLGIIMLHSPIKDPEHWFCYSLMKMSLIALSKAEEYGISRESLSLENFRVQGSFGNWDRDYDLPEFTEERLATLYRLMPHELCGTSAKLFLGLRITRQELIDSDPAQRDSAFRADMGL